MSRGVEKEVSTQAVLTGKFSPELQKILTLAT